MDQNNLPNQDINYQPQTQGYTFSAENPQGKKKRKNIFLIMKIIIVLFFLTLLSFFILNFFNIINVLPSLQKNNIQDYLENNTSRFFNKPKSDSVHKKIPGVKSLDNKEGLIIYAILKKVNNYDLEIDYMDKLYSLKMTKNTECATDLTTLNKNATDSADIIINSTFLNCSDVSNYLNRDVKIIFNIINDENIISFLNIITN